MIDTTVNLLDEAHEKINMLCDENQYLNIQIEDCKRQCFNLKKEVDELAEQVKILERQAIATAAWAFILVGVAIGAVAIFM